MSDRYTVLGSIAKGGMGVVYLGRMAGSAGFSRLVAIKRLHRELAAERGLVAMLVDEARMASRIRHANVIDTLDLVVYDGAFSLVLEYVEGDSLAALMRRAHDAGEKVPCSIALALMHGILRGLDAAHEARSEDGAPLGLVHRDVSPQNVLVGVDGVPRVIDFGVAKALGRLGSTSPGEVRGKYTYMAPEQLRSRPVTRQADVYSAGVVFWELLAQRRLFSGDDWAAIIREVMSGKVPKPSDVDPDVPRELDAIVTKATARDLGARYLTARELLDDLKPFPRATDDEVGAWVRRLAADELAKRQRLVQESAPANDSESVEELLEGLRRTGANARAELELEPEHVTTRTVAAAPLTAVFDLPSPLETSKEVPTASVAPRRYGAAAALAILAGLALLTFAVRRNAPPVDAPPVEDLSASRAVLPASDTSTASAPPSAAFPNVPAVSSVVATASAPILTAAPVRSELPKRQKPVPTAAPYDPGNFR
jgi:serine/threonine-protein kinase